MSHILFNRSNPAITVKHSHFGEYPVCSIHHENIAPIGTLFMLHGMNHLGNQDPRIIKLGKSFASIGFKVCIPRFSSICNHEFNASQQTQDIRQTLLWLINQKSLCPEGKLAVFAPSFSSGLLIKAIATDSFKNRITAILLLGPYFDLEALIQQFVFDEKMDHYARLIIFKNLFKQQYPDNKITLDVLQKAIDYAYLCQPFPGSIRNDPALPDEYHSFIAAVIKNKALPKTFLTHFQSHLTKFKSDFSYIDLLKNIDTSWFLLHSACDNIFNPLESVRLNQTFDHLSQPSTLVITKILNHADLSYGLSTIPEAVKLIKFFQSFIKAGTI